MITAIQLKQIIGTARKYTDPQLSEFANTFNLIFTKYQINTKLRICHFVCQVLHESGYLWFSREEWGPTERQKGYEFRHDLGNTSVGDGLKYRGAGWIEVTGKYNFMIMSKELGQDFVTHPELLAQQPWCGLSAGAYWNNHSLNVLADKDDIEDITRRINGGEIGEADRLMLLNKCKQFIN